MSQKRTRKLVVRQNFETAKFFETDEYDSENDKSITDFTDSEDEWGAINQPKNKVKQLLKTPSKLVELEKRLSEEGKMLKYNTNQSDEYNGYSKSLVGIKNNDNISLLEEKYRKPIDQTFISQKRTRKLVTHGFETAKFYESDEYVSENDKSTSDFTDSEDEWRAINQPKNKVKQLLQNPSKLVKLEKCLRRKNTKHSTNKVFDTSKNKKSIKSVKLIKTQNKVKCSNNTFVSDHNKRLVQTKNIDDVCRYEQLVLIDTDKVENKKPPDGLIQGEIINLNGDMPNNVIEASISTCTKNKNRKLNKQDNYKPIESGVISVKKNDKIIISDEDDVQFISMTAKPKTLHLKKIKPCSLKTNTNKPYNSVSANRQMKPTNYIKCQATSSVMHKLSKNITIMPANIHVPKGIEVTMVERAHTSIHSHFNSIKKISTMSNGRPPNNPSTINVKCEVIPKPNLNGEVKFYIRLPNGKEHPGPNDLINKYLRRHNNQLPDYWMVPLPVEVAKQYGF